MQFVIVQHTDIALVRSYLPSNYFVFFAQGSHLVVAGEDDHGWTATGYVIPRLRSAVIPARLITPQDYAEQYMASSPAPHLDPLPQSTLRILEPLSKQEVDSHPYELRHRAGREKSSEGRHALHAPRE